MNKHRTSSAPRIYIPPFALEIGFVKFGDTPSQPVRKNGFIRVEYDGGTAMAHSVWRLGIQADGTLEIGEAVMDQTGFIAPGPSQSVSLAQIFQDPDACDVLFRHLDRPDSHAFIIAADNWARKIRKEAHDVAEPSRDPDDRWFDDIRSGAGISSDQPGPNA